MNMPLKTEENVLEKAKNSIFNDLRVSELILDNQIERF